ncbi:MAG: ABC-type transport auxiliary lipoprotein family protein [Nitrospirota bacterium]
MQRFFVVILSVFLIAACTMPVTKIYSIYVDTSAKKERVKERGFTSNPPAERSVAILVDVPRYLSQPYIAYRTSPYQLEISRYSKWEAPPGDMVRELFREKLFLSGYFHEVRASSVVPEGFYALEIKMKKFERFDDADGSFGDLLLEIKMTSPDNREIYYGTMAGHVRLADKSFLSLAMGLSKALSDSIDGVIDDIAGVLSN